MQEFFRNWNQASLTSLSFFWMAFWAFCLGYVISSCIQVFVTRQRMQQAMGESGPRSVGLATFFGFLSSSCSFAALATSKSLFKKGAGLVPALAFLLASTNLVIELGILIAIFLSWQFVVGEYVGGILLILIMWILVKLTLPSGLEQEAREHAGGDEPEQTPPDWRKLIRKLDGWRRVARQYFMEWGMVWRDVAFGFTVAGVISAFVPASFFTTLFVGAGTESDPGFGQLLLQTVVAPLAAFLTFIGSMGNIPLASILFANGVSFAGIMAFIFSDLVVFPVLRISAKYFGWKMAVYILAVFLVCLIVSALALHYGLWAIDLLPQASKDAGNRVQPSERFQIDYTFFLNLAFAVVTAGFFWLTRSGGNEADDNDGDQRSGEEQRETQDGESDQQHQNSDQSDDAASWSDRILTGLAVLSFLWLAGGLLAGGVAN